jgi:CubicO group peptidase (beta-lactamase class C family)
MDRGRNGKMMKTSIVQPSALLSMLGFLVLLHGHAAQAGTGATVDQVVSTFAANAVQTGHAVGVAVGVVFPSRAGSTLKYYSFGTANAATNAAVTPNTLFEIASNTKVFTTNLLGQAIANNTLSLATNLKTLSAQVGVMKSVSRRVTLRELGDFTAGFPDYAPLCASDSVPGCLPSTRPTPTVYTAADFLTFFQNTVPTNYANGSDAALTTLPGPYFYSDFSIGLLGLILATPMGPIGSGAVDAWYDQVDSEILTPLGMDSTYLTVPPNTPGSRVAAGYSPATAEAVVTGGAITAIDVVDAGGAYAAAPSVTVTGGGGSGATATATIGGRGTVTAINVGAQGANYIAPATIAFNSGGASTIARAVAIVSGGSIVAIEITAGGAGYTKVPNVTITGGRSAGGADATATAHIADGRVTSVSVTGGGSGYVTPLSVVVAPGSAEANVIPVWAPAGALTSSVKDMMAFAAAALGQTTVGALSVPAALTAGFQIAEKEYACTGATPGLSTCPATTERIGLAWGILPKDTANGVPEIITKNGALPGFSSQIVLIPRKQIAVVVLVNSDDSAPAELLAYQIAYGLLDANVH